MLKKSMIHNDEKRNARSTLDHAYFCLCTLYIFCNSKKRKKKQLQFSTWECNKKAVLSMLISDSIFIILIGCYSSGIEWFVEMEWQVFDLVWERLCSCLWLFYPDEGAQVGCDVKELKKEQKFERTCFNVFMLRWMFGRVTVTLNDWEMVLIVTKGSLWCSCGSSIHCAIRWKCGKRN